MIKENVLKDLYLVQMKTDEEIAKILNTSKMTICRNRKKFNIKTFERWQRNYCEPTEEQKEIIYGSLLGDGSISNGFRKGIRYQSIFEEKHCSKQKDYVFWKYLKLKNLCLSEPKEIKNSLQWRIRTFAHPFFSKLRENIYPREIKTLNETFLNNIGPLGLAVWYMDDGTISKQSNFVKFCTCSFTINEHQILIKWLKNKFSLETYMKIYGKYRFLVVEKESRKLLFQILKEYVINSMKYKITFREFHTWQNF